MFSSPGLSDAQYAPSARRGVNADVKVCLRRLGQLRGVVLLRRSPVAREGGVILESSMALARA